MNPNETASEPATKSGAGGFFWVYWAGGLLVLYVLSVGPAVWVWRHTTNPALKTTLEFVYWPLEQASKKSETLEAILVTYVDLWIDPT